MTKVTEHEAGMFSWADHASADPESAKKFYGELFGWIYDDRPAGPGVIYSIAKLEGGSAAAIYTQQQDERDQGIPPHWTAYTTVEDVDAVARRASEIGGKVLAPPFDVMDVGRMAVIADPSGAVMAYWQPKRHIGAEVVQSHGTLTWAELATRRPEDSKRFHTRLLGYEADDMPMPNGTYTVLKVGEKPAVGLLPMPEHVPAHVPSHWLVYFNVTDCDATVDKAKVLGATVLTPIMHVPGVGRFASLTDPTGAAFAVIQGEDG